MINRSKNKAAEAATQIANVATPKRPWRELGSFQPAISPQRPYLVIAYGIIPSARIPPFLPVVSQSYVNREACWGGNIKTPRKANTPELPPPCASL